MVLGGSDTRTVLDTSHKATQWISVKRGKRQQYRIKGSNGILAFKVDDSDYPKKVLDAIKPAEQ